MEGVVLIPLDCGHYAVFTVESVNQNGVPSKWWCNRCRIASPTAIDADYLRGIMSKDH